MKGESKLHKYLSNLLRHGWEESWIPELSLEQVAVIASLANAELHRRMKSTSEEHDHD